MQFNKDNQSKGSLKLGPAGIEITSSVLGVLILGFSTAFLYLYLVHVFPIEEIGQQSPSSLAIPSSTPSETQ